MAKAAPKVEREQYHRFTVKVGGRYIGMYEAASVLCPKGRECRKNKPSGSWLPKAGKTFPGAISLFTARGMKRYTSSRLRGWHASLLPRGFRVYEQVVVIRGAAKPLYEDQYQIIVKPNRLHVIRSLKSNIVMPTDRNLYDLEIDEKLRKATSVHEQQMAEIDFNLI